MTFTVIGAKNDQTNSAPLKSLVSQRLAPEKKPQPFLGQLPKKTIIK
jgi:hypothetical protein